MKNMIQILNDRLRTSGMGGRIVCTRTLMSNPKIRENMDRVRNFNDFNKGNDPYKEHDFGKFEYEGDDIMWKIDYYSDDSYTYASEDPSNPEKTERVLTVMYADEY